MSPLRYQTAVRTREVDGEKTFDADRLAQHKAEHETGEPAPELLDFRETRGLNGVPVAEISLADVEG